MIEHMHARVFEVLLNAHLAKPTGREIHRCRHPASIVQPGGHVLRWQLGRRRWVGPIGGGDPLRRTARWTTLVTDTEAEEPVLLLDTVGEGRVRVHVLGETRTSSPDAADAERGRQAITLAVLLEAGLRCRR